MHNFKINTTILLSVIVILNTAIKPYYRGKLPCILYLIRTSALFCNYLDRHACSCSAKRPHYHYS